MSENSPSKSGRSSISNGVVKVAVVFVSVVFSFGLAVVGWGGPAAFFSHPPLVALAVATVALTVASLFTEGNLSSGVREDRDNRWVIPALGILGFLLSWLSALADRLDFWTIDGDATRWIGLGVFVAGGILRIAPVFVLGRRFSGLVAIQPGHTLVTNGLYKHMRNPSYLGLLINSLGWALAFRSGVGILLTTLMLVPLVVRIHSEEKMLHSQFGTRWEEYRSRTWRLVPGLY